MLNFYKKQAQETIDKITPLNNKLLELLDEINSIEKKYQRQKIQDEKENQYLESEIDRLNRLIKILSSELK